MSKIIDISDALAGASRAGQEKRGPRLNPGKPSKRDMVRFLESIGLHNSTDMMYAPLPGVKWFSIKESKSIITVKTDSFDTTKIAAWELVNAGIVNRKQQKCQVQTIKIYRACPWSQPLPGVKWTPSSLE